MQTIKFQLFIQRGTQPITGKKKVQTEGTASDKKPRHSDPASLQSREQDQSIAPLFSKWEVSTVLGHSKDHSRSERT